MSELSKNNKKSDQIPEHSSLNILIMAMVIFFSFTVLGHYLYYSIVAPAFNLPQVDYKSFLTLVVLVRLLFSK
jgi:hypothetical protein